VLIRVCDGVEDSFNAGMDGIVTVVFIIEGNSEVQAERKRHEIRTEGINHFFLGMEKSFPKTANGTLIQYINQ
jgi:glyoxylate utilization-related uncharacterized protein